MANCSLRASALQQQRSGLYHHHQQNEDDEDDGLEHVVPSRIGARSRRGIHSGGGSSVANQRQTTSPPRRRSNRDNIQRSLDLLRHFIGQERRMSGRRDVKVVFIEISELCCATKVNDKQIIFCNNFQRDEPPDTGRRRRGRGLGPSVPRRLSTGAEGCFRIVAAVAVDSSDLLDFLLIDESVSSASELEPEAEIGRLEELPASGPAAWSDCSDDSGGVRLVLGSGGSAGINASGERGRSAGQGWHPAGQGLPKGNFRRTSLGSDYFEQFCVKCRIYLLENFQKFRSNFSIMSRVSMT